MISKYMFENLDEHPLSGYGLHGLNMCDQLVYEKKTNMIDQLKKDIKKKDAMIDWLCAKLQSYCDNPIIHNCDECRKSKDCHNHNWRKAAEKNIIC